MAELDILPFRSQYDTPPKAAYPASASETYRHGEPVVFSSNELSEASDDPAAIMGIAADGAIEIANDTSGGLNGNAASAGTPRTVYRTIPGEEFIARNFATDGSATAATPTVAEIGDLAGLTTTGGDWYVDTGATNLICRISDVLDNRKNSIDNPHLVSGTTTFVVVEFI